METTELAGQPESAVNSLAEIIEVDSVDDLQSMHDYDNNMDQCWSYSVPGAGGLKVLFSNETVVENGADFIYIYDKHDIQIGKYTGTQLADKTIAIPGDTVKIRLTSDRTVTAYGFAVSDIVSMNSISLKSIPAKTTFFVGQEPDYKGLVV